jgi:tRNA dimethylallyltransferase
MAPQGERPPLLVIVGPTAAGKTAEALARAEDLGSEIVGADSVQVYRGLDIGSAKPNAEEQARVRHHAIDLWEPTLQANAGAWLTEAERAIAALHERDKTPVVCGGTGLYVRALTEGLAAIPDVPEAIQAEVRERLAVEGARALHAELTRLDPETAARLAPADGQRVARALEVLMATGESLTAFQERHRRVREGGAEPRYTVHMVGLFPPRAELERRIAVRASAMLDAGLVDEVRDLLAAGVPHDAPGLMTLGYREIVAQLRRDGDAIRGAPGREALRDALARAHRRYAKRQLTWWRRVHFDELI